MPAPEHPTTEPRILPRTSTIIASLVIAVTVLAGTSIALRSFAATNTGPAAETNPLTQFVNKWTDAGYTLENCPTDGSAPGQISIRYTDGTNTGWYFSCDPGTIVAHAPAHPGDNLATTSGGFIADIQGHLSN